ncbi:MAG: hypothetical protein HRT72_07755 [Flavobacteriales bacterium]|nr:hypothetical protein [Flavobacteriales bacterium]
MKLLSYSFIIILFSASSVFAGRNTTSYEFDFRINPSFSSIITGQKLHRPHLNLNYGVRGSYLKGKSIYTVGFSHLTQGGNTRKDSTLTKYEMLDKVKTIAFPIEYSYALIDKVNKKTYAMAGLVIGSNYAVSTINRKSKQVQSGEENTFNQTIDKKYIAIKLGITLKYRLQKDFQLNINPTITYQVNGIKGNKTYKSNLIMFSVSLGILRLSSI